EALVAEAAVEALDEAVLHWLAGSDVVPVDLVILGPAQDHHAGELGAVVADHSSWPTPSGDDGIELTHDAPAAKRGVRNKCQALARVVVHHGEHPEAPPVGEGIGDEVQAPALVGPTWHEHRAPRAQGSLAATALADLQLLLAIEPPELLDVDLEALPLQHHVDAPIAEPAPLGRDRLHGLTQLPITRSRASIPDARTIDIKSFTRPPLAHSMHQARMSHRIP